MIRLHVDEWCNDCRDFEPVSEKTDHYAREVNGFEDLTEIAYTDTEIRCKDCDKCRRVKEFLAKKGNAKDPKKFIF